VRQFRETALAIAVLVAGVSASCAYALDEQHANTLITKFLAAQKSPDGEGDAAQHVIADLDGDGKQDLVLLWNLMGPTNALPKLTVFMNAGNTYHSFTADLVGQTEKITVKGPAITVDTLTLGKNDPLCCPTVKKQLHYRWQSGKLMPVR
jgi:hypothetical protein